MDTDREGVELTDLGVGLKKESDVLEAGGGGVGAEEKVAVRSCERPRGTLEGKRGGHRGVRRRTLS